MSLSLRLAAIAGLLGTALGSMPRPAGALEIIPSVGVTRAVDSDEAKPFAGVALRTSLLPGILKSELGVAYRSESYYGGNLKVRQWPITASVWLAPGDRIYGGAGVGWYHTTLDYEEVTGIQDETKQKFGVHLGGGLGFPIGGPLAIDLHGRYVMMQKQESRLIPSKFDPDFWALSAGLKFRLGI